jgi:hypothetical protein
MTVSTAEPITAHTMGVDQPSTAKTKSSGRPNWAAIHAPNQADQPNSNGNPKAPSEYLASACPNAPQIAALTLGRNRGAWRQIRPAAPSPLLSLAARWAGFVSVTR